MTRDEIISMAREADAAHDEVVVTPFLERFAALVAAAEREACAKVCDEMSGSDYLPNQCADAIRARSLA